MPAGKARPAWNQGRRPAAARRPASEEPWMATSELMRGTAGMSEDINRGDAEVLAELRSVIDQVDAVPADVVAAAKASFTWRTVDAELAQLAELTFDSLVDEDAGVLVRGGEQPRLLTFGAAGVEIEVEATATASGRSFRLLGQVVPPAAGQLEVR